MPSTNRRWCGCTAPGPGVTALTNWEITQPVLIVHGDDDRLMPVECGRWYADVLPNSRLVVVADAGHWLQIEHHDRFVTLVRDFLTADVPDVARR